MSMFREMVKTTNYLENNLALWKYVWGVGVGGKYECSSFVVSSSVHFRPGAPF